MRRHSEVWGCGEEPNGRWARGWWGRDVLGWLFLHFKKRWLSFLGSEFAVWELIAPINTICSIAIKARVASS